MARVQIQINGAPYSLTPNRFGYKVVSLGKRTDRFYRVYQVQTHEDGSPKLCSCPDCFYRGRWCKHLSAIANYLDLQRMPSWTPSTITEDEL